MMTKEEHIKLRKLADAATPGPWQIIGRVLGSDNYLVGHSLLAEVEVGKERNAKFIAASRTAIPALIDEVERLRQALEFYGDKKNHMDIDRAGCGCCMAKAVCELPLADCLIAHYPSPIDLDSGQRARDVLKDYK